MAASKITEMIELIVMARSECDNGYRTSKKDYWKTVKSVLGNTIIMSFASEEYIKND